MSVNVHMVTIQSIQPKMLGAFWSQVLDLVIVAEEEDSIFLAPASGQGLMVSLERADHAPGGGVRLDISGEPLETEIPRILALGATLVSEHQVPGVRWKVLADPEGNHLAVVEHSEPPHE